MPSNSTITHVRTLDGLYLAATLVTPDQPTNRAVVLVHGGGVTREEGGFFTRLAAGLADAGIASLRFDLRGHGDSEGRQEELTMAATLNDIRVSITHLREATGASEIGLCGASFAGGICAYYAAKRPDDLSRLVLLNPQVDYKQRTIDSRDYWSNDVISDERARELNDTGALQFKADLKHGRPFLNEVFWFRPMDVLSEIKAPTLIIHGNADTLVPIDGSREAATKFTAPVEFVEIEGSQHGFAVHDDPQYLNPKSQEYQAEVIETVARWLNA
ncbi:alpha/beta hydrolase [Nocardia sp. 852002-20019_SCH5090214]|uniref:alpha/beta hydrolase n=1 Tax=Nocardia sp. 852002-20019_SCH5090214 TaxID=1834087 RepID=UPI0007EA2098|nr:alpha/beta fold hydrolase [Nocardia sp. 852002-20019_SCH5090214]OBA68233.1 alpha/beta hydrolase [Nocardia sp. 852002-20019_SCH5090214]